MKAAIAWVKKWGAALFGVLLACVGAGWLWRRKQAEVAKLRDQAAVERALREMDTLRAVRERVKAEEAHTEADLSLIDEKLRANRRAVVEAHEGMENLKDEEVDAAFERLGF